MKLSPWFNFYKKNKPINKGVYLVKTGFIKHLGKPCEHYAKWNGKYWHSQEKTIKMANKQIGIANYQSKYWRGIVK